LVVSVGVLDGIEVVVAFISPREVDVIVEFAAPPERLEEVLSEVEVRVGVVVVVDEGTRPGGGDNCDVEEVGGETVIEEIGGTVALSDDEAAVTVVTLVELCSSFSRLFELGER
jgi:hypothetical protein